jgi:hypothetical protein
MIQILSAALAFSVTINVCFILYCRGLIKAGRELHDAVEEHLRGKS